jgi:hypothetical protein
LTVKAAPIEVTVQNDGTLQVEVTVSIDEQTLQLENLATR